MKIALLVFLLGLNARAETLKSAVYEFEQAGTGKKQVYLYAANENSVQLFRCGPLGPQSDQRAGFTALTGLTNLDLLARKHCVPLFDPAQNKQGRMMKAVKNGKVISLHLGGTDGPQANALAMLGDAKSWLAVFNFNSDDDKSILFTGVGIEAGAGVPRTDLVRATLDKVAEGVLSADFPLLPLQKL